MTEQQERKLAQAITYLKLVSAICMFLGVLLIAREVYVFAVVAIVAGLACGQVSMLFRRKLQGK